MKYVVACNTKPRVLLRYRINPPDDPDTVRLSFSAPSVLDSNEVFVHCGALTENAKALLDGRCVEDAHLLVLQDSLAMLRVACHQEGPHPIILALYKCARKAVRNELWVLSNPLSHRCSYEHVVDTYLIRP